MNGWEMIGDAGCPIVFRRTLVACRFGKLLVHRFVSSAGREHPHDHPASFLTIALRGGYDDVSICPDCSVECPGWTLGEPSADWRHAQLMTPCSTCRCTGRIVDHVRAPTFRFRRAEHAHVTLVCPGGALTLVLMGPKRRVWGFFHERRWWAFQDYEARFGSSFRCDDGIVALDEGKA